MKKHVGPIILAIFFTLWTIVFGTWFIIADVVFIGPIITCIAAVYFWVAFIIEQVEKKKAKGQKED